MALENTNTALASLKAAVDRIVAKSQADDGTITALNQELAEADSAAAADIAAMTDAINAEAPAPAPVPADPAAQ